MKSIQQHLQNAFQPAPQAGPPPLPRNHTQESFQPPPKKKHTEESFRSASTAGADAMKAVQQHLQNAFQSAPQAAPPPSTKKRKHTEESFQPAPQPAQSQKKKHTEESFRPVSTAGADAMKAVQQHLQNAFQSAPQAAPPSSTKKKHTEESFQPAPQPAQSQKKKKHTEASFQPAAAAGAATRKAVQQLLQNAFQPSPQTKRKALEYRPAFASFASNLKDASKLAQAAFQAAPAPSSGGWGPVSINSNGTFTLPLIGTYPLPSPGQMKKIDLQDGKFFKIRQRADGAYEGKFGPDALPAQQQPKAPSQPPPGWQRVNVDADGMVRLPNFAAPLYPPQPGQTETIHIDPRTTFIMRRAEDGEVHGTFETKAPAEPPPGWTRVNVDSDGMIRLPGHTQSFYPPQPGKTETIQLDDKTTFILSHTADGEIFGTFETKAPPEEAPEDQPGLDVDDSKREYEGVVTTRLKDGKKVVDVGALGTLVAPAVGGHDSYLMGFDKMLVLFGRPDGTVEVSTRKLGIEKKGSGFKGALLPSEGKLEFAGDVYDVSKLQPGQKIKDSIKIKGEKFKVEVRMNHDGTVTVTGKQNKGFFEKLLDFAGKFLPILAAIPGLGVLAVAAKVVTVFNAVKNFAQSLKTGNLLGMVGSAASVAVNFSQGAFQAFASKVANLANVGQQVITTLKHGLGNGLLQVVSNGANLVSGIAQAAADLGQGGFKSGATNVAQVANNVGGYAGGLDGAVKGDPTSLLAVAGKDVVNHVVSNNPPQAQNPVANQPGGTGYAFSTSTQLTPFGSPPSTGYAFSTSTQLTPFESPPADPPPLVKGPKDPVGKDPKKDPIVKDLSPDGKNPKDWKDLNWSSGDGLPSDGGSPGEGPSPDDDRPFAPKKAPVLVAGGPGAPISSAKPNTRAQNLLELLKEKWKEQTQFNSANVWGLWTDGLSNGINLINHAPLLLGASSDLPIGEPLQALFTTVLGRGADDVLKRMGAQEIGQAFMRARRPWSTEGEVRAEAVQLTVEQVRNNLAYVGPVVSKNPRVPSIASMYQTAIRTGTPQSNIFVTRTALLGSVEVLVTVTKDGRVAVQLRDGWRWSTTTTNGMGNYNWHGGGTARNIASGFGELLTGGKRVVVPITSEAATNRLRKGENRSDMEILREFGGPLNEVQRNVRRAMWGD